MIWLLRAETINTTTWWPMQWNSSRHQLISWPPTMICWAYSSRVCERRMSNSATSTSPVWLIRQDQSVSLSALRYHQISAVLWRSMGKHCMRRIRMSSQIRTARLRCSQNLAFEAIRLSLRLSSSERSRNHLSRARFEQQVSKASAFEINSSKQTRKLLSLNMKMLTKLEQSQREAKSCRSNLSVVGGWLSQEAQASTRAAGETWTKVFWWSLKMSGLARYLKAPTGHWRSKSSLKIRAASMFPTGGKTKNWAKTRLWERQQLHGVSRNKSLSSFLWVCFKKSETSLPSRTKVQSKCMCKKCCEMLKSGYRKLTWPKFS